MQNHNTILIVDDDQEITTLLAEYLANFAFDVLVANDAFEMREQLASHSVDLVVMDLMLPGTDGLTLAREIRLQSEIPVIMLTARSSLIDRVVGLESGADDYIGKPFEPRELVARIQSVLRRTHNSISNTTRLVASSDIVSFDGWELHRHERTLTSPTGLVVPLSNAEFKLLTTFLHTPRRLLSRDQLMEHARGRAMDAFERSIDLLVSRLRQKLAEDANEPSMIKTVRGAGYIFNVQSVQGRAAWAS